MNKDELHISLYDLISGVAAQLDRTSLPGLGQPARRGGQTIPVSELRSMLTRALIASGESFDLLINKVIENSDAATTLLLDVARLLAREDVAQLPYACSYLVASILAYQQDEDAELNPFAETLLKIKAAELMDELVHMDDSPESIAALMAKAEPLQEEAVRQTGKGLWSYLPGTPYQRVQALKMRGGNGRDGRVVKTTIDLLEKRYEVGGPFLFSDEEYRAAEVEAIAIVVTEDGRKARYRGAFKRFLDDLGLPETASLSVVFEDAPPDLTKVVGVTSIVEPLGDGVKITIIACDESLRLPHMLMESVAQMIS